MPSSSDNCGWDLLPVIFPFHLAIAKDLSLASVGPSLSKIGIDASRGDHLFQSFSIITPTIEPTYDAIREAANTVFFLRDKKETLILKGQMVENDLNGESKLLFLCSPVIKDVNDFGELGLTLNDFPMHDSTVDFLVLLQTQNNMLTDARRMADRLKAEIKTRKQAQESLLESNELLEVKVEERTNELRQVNKQLEQWNLQLESRNREMAILNAMGEMLQACGEVQDAFPIVESSMKELFPESSGRLACFEKDLGAFKVSRHWGETTNCPGPLFGQHECTALRNGQTLHFDGRHDTHGCPRLNVSSGNGCVCRPIKVSDKTLGLLQLRYSIESMREPHKGMTNEQVEQQRKLVTTASEHIGLALSNLRLQEFLREQAIMDPLTGLYNRRHMEAFFKHEVEQAKRTTTPIGVILVDVDHFKAVNDTHGHQAGDTVLMQLASILASNTRSGDIACRYGGEEFLIVLPAATKEQAAKRAEKLRNQIEHSLAASIQELGNAVITASIGVAAYPADGDHYEAAIRAADKALYSAKEQGRNQVVAAGEAEG